MRVTSLLCALPLLLAACTPENAMTAAMPPQPTDGPSPAQGRAALNPAPRQAYELLLTLADVPGPFAQVEGVAQYDVVNEDQCGHVNPLTGTAERITHQQPVALEQVGPGQYRGRVYLDLMLDEDYYGRGVCQWQFSGAGTLLKATGAAGETRFTAFIDAQAIAEGQTVTRLYPATDYPRVAEIDDYGQPGKADAGSYVATLRDQLFSATLQANKVDN